jgi:DNA (cytosine-5)-methyltransferase 1
MKRKRGRSKIDAVDLFCGAGGLSYGLSREGITVRAGFDLDPACEWPFKKNVKALFHCEDVGKLSGSKLRRHYRRSSIRLLAGCAPCQRFSSYTQKDALSDRQRWRLLESFGRIATELEPEIITMENVPGLARHRRFKQFVQTLQHAGYSVWSDIVECADYGMPQHRRRVVVLASKLGPLELLTPKQFGAKRGTVKDAIGKLPKVVAGQAHRSDSLHRASKLSVINKKRISASRQLGTWRDWPDDLILPCHRKATGEGYPSIYGRMAWSNQSPTITTLAYNYGSGRFGHPTQDRAITLREAALLQTFPRKYSFIRPNDRLNVRIVGRLIGNAVPVVLARVIGRSIIAHVESLKSRRRANSSSQPERRHVSKRR